MLRELAGRRQPRSRFYEAPGKRLFRLEKAYDDPPVYRAYGPVDPAAGKEQPTVTVRGKRDIHDCRSWDAAKAALSGELSRISAEAEPEMPAMRR